MRPFSLFFLSSSSLYLRADAHHNSCCHVLLSIHPPNELVAISGLNANNRDSVCVCLPVSHCGCDPVCVTVCEGVITLALMEPVTSCCEVSPPVSWVALGFQGGGGGTGGTFVSVKPQWLAMPFTLRGKEIITGVLYGDQVEFNDLGKRSQS